MVLGVAVLLAAVDAGVANEGVDFIDDVRLVFQVTTCQSVSLPPPLDAAVVNAYCNRMRPKFDRFRAHWGTAAKQFIASVRPAAAPSEVLYPFGGGDLMMALTAFPEASVITTLSLELAGDPRRLKRLADRNQLAQSLRALEEAATSTLLANDSKSVNLSKIQRGELPGQLSMHLMGLALHGYEPVAVRFFRIENDGSLHYYTAADIDSLDHVKASKLKESWKAPDFSVAFANVEVEFTVAGNLQGARKIHRHIGANLSNDGLLQQPGLLKHFEAKGPLACMTKAASYLLWNDTFSVMRTWLVEHVVFMISDSTGVPPRYWIKKGCTVETFGSFQRSFLGTWEGYQQELREAFADAKPIPMRFGYPDGSPEKRSHFLVANCLATPR